jgi:DNA modification methylase
VSNGVVVSTVDGVSRAEFRAFGPEEYASFLAVKARVPRYEVDYDLGDPEAVPTVIAPGPWLAAAVDGTGKSPLGAVDPGVLAGHLFDYQRYVVAAAILKRRFACFADTGLGKTVIFLEWLRHALADLPAGTKALVVSPLMVMRQTMDEERKFYGGASILTNCREGGFDAWLDGPSRAGIVNWDLFREPVDFRGRVGCVVGDETSILKNEAGVIRTNFIAACRGVPWKLACSATPAPNDREEYANHALFLDQIRSHQEFFARFFVNDAKGDGGKGWRLKPHAKAGFYRHLAGWSVFIRDPKRYGFGDNLKAVPPYRVQVVDVPLTDAQRTAGQRFLRRGSQRTFFADAGAVGGLEARGRLSQISKGFLYSRNGSGTEHIPSRKPEAVAEIVGRHPREQVVVWTAYDEEGELIADALRKVGGREVALLTGKTPQEERADVLEQFRVGSVGVLVTKPRLCGFGLNWQHCTVQVWSGLRDSFEEYYQGVRRSYRYGQTQAVTVYVPVTEWERAYLKNVERKQRTFLEDATYQEDMYIQSLAAELRGFIAAPEKFMAKTVETFRPVASGRGWKAAHGDSVEVLKKLPEASVDLAVFSPPFASLFTYTPSVGDMGNCGDRDGEFALHFRFFLPGLFRVMKPGRNVCVHVMPLPRFKAVHGNMGLYDFRGDVIRLLQREGFLYYGEAAIPKNPQAQAIRTKSHALMFVSLERDSLACRPALNDYLLVFKKPGEPEQPVEPECSREEWIKWASGVWDGIRETDVLKVKGTKDPEDGKHICPLQLEFIERCVRLWSNPGEVVLDPFMGIGSTGVVALRRKRRFVGIELKQLYFDAACRNLKAADRTGGQRSILDGMK